MALCQRQLHVADITQTLFTLKTFDKNR